MILNGLFSACILFNVLGAMGVRRVRTLGVDGGTSYAASFADIAATVKLANGLPTYDWQFQDLAASIERFGLNWSPLTGLPLGARALLLRSRVRYHLRAFYRRHWKGRLRRRA